MPLCNTREWIMTRRFWVRSTSLWSDLHGHNWWNWFKLWSFDMYHYSWALHQLDQKIAHRGRTTTTTTECRDFLSDASHSSSGLEQAFNDYHWHDLAQLLFGEYLHARARVLEWETKSPLDTFVEPWQDAFGIQIMVWYVSCWYTEPNKPKYSIIEQQYMEPCPSQVT
jgi:hypothetical protein